MTAFRNLTDAHGAPLTDNFRPIQRTIYRGLSDPIYSPVIASYRYFFNNIEFIT